MAACGDSSTPARGVLTAHLTPATLSRSHAAAHSPPSGTRIPFAVAGDTTAKKGHGKRGKGRGLGNAGTPHLAMSSNATNTERLINCLEQMGEGGTVAGVHGADHCTAAPRLGLVLTRGLDMPPVSGRPSKKDVKQQAKAGSQVVSMYMATLASANLVH